MLTGLAKLFLKVILGTLEECFFLKVKGWWLSGFLVWSREVLLGFWWILLVGFELALPRPRLF